MPANAETRPTLPSLPPLPDMGEGEKNMVPDVSASVEGEMSVGAGAMSIPEAKIEAEMESILPEQVPEQRVDMVEKPVQPEVLKWDEKWNKAGEAFNFLMTYFKEKAATVDPNQMGNYGIAVGSLATSFDQEWGKLAIKPGVELGKMDEAGLAKAANELVSEIEMGNLGDKFYGDVGTLKKQIESVVKYLGVGKIDFVRYGGEIEAERVAPVKEEENKAIEMSVPEEKTVEIKLPEIDFSEMGGEKAETGDVSAEKQMDGEKMQQAREELDKMGQEVSESAGLSSEQAKMPEVVADKKMGERIEESELLDEVEPALKKKMLVEMQTRVEEMKKELEKKADVETDVLAENFKEEKQQPVMKTLYVNYFNELEQQNLDT